MTDEWREGADNSMVTRSDNDHGAMSEHRCDAGVEPTSRYQPAVKRERLEQEGIGDKQKVITRMKGLDGQVDHRLVGQSHHSLALDS